MINIHSQSSVLSSAYNALVTRSHTSGQDAQSGQDASVLALSKLQDKALAGIAREIPGMEVGDLKKLDASDYTPDKIADRISQFVSSGLQNARARGKSDEEIQALYDSAMKGVERGFKEAKDILSNLKVLEGDIATQVADTEKATFDSLAELDPSKQTASLTETVVAAAMSERYQRAEDFSLQLRTKEGDTVKVSFSRNLDIQNSVAAAADGEGNQAMTWDLSRTESTGYRFSVQGDLNEDELQAIQSLVQDVGKVASEFYSGDVQKAFEQVSDVSFDSSQLASMNLRMSRSEQYSAAQQYQQTQQLENPDQARAGKRLGHLMNDMAQSYSNPALEFLDQARESATQIMKNLVEQDSLFKDASSEQQSLYQGHLDKFFDALSGMDS
ncbi:DUF5610 domain-containing protein [Imhoffiella purpurea]|uniref:DUF5610 domain-containing protein n=1 Tax=Imhoffiella purpurea TaxID=1249627 RepID=W9W2R3_9GAMM|nr:DUF5610 domain-containing protein [Imhoffiella purpurea]EXJ16840.1 hypothetical protein D779_2451 [Imhoffiella purpurea]